MKDMHFPLDMLWIREGRIIGISHNVPAVENGAISRRNSPGPADAVLEVNAGWAERNAIEIGDAVEVSTE